MTMPPWVPLNGLVTSRAQERGEALWPHLERPIPMDQVTLGPRYSAVDMARDCGCLICQDFVDAYERRMAPFTDSVMDVLKSSGVTMRAELWHGHDDENCTAPTE